MNIPIKKSVVLLTSFLVLVSLALADKMVQIEVKATIGGGTSTLSVTGTPVFNGGNALTTNSGRSRYESSTLTVNYFAANGPWDLGVYTTRTDEIAGLADKADGEVNVNTIPLKFTTFFTEGSETIDPNDDLQWSSSDPEELKFFTVLDVSAVDDNNDPFYARLASSEAGDLASDSIEFKFATDAAGGSEGAEHSAVVTIILNIM